MSAFVGSWERAEIKNINEYFTALGVPNDVQKMMMDNKEIIELTLDGNTWHFVSYFGKETNKVSLTVGTTGDYKTHTGFPMKGIIKSAGEKMIEEHFAGDVKIDCVREIVNGQLCVTLTAKGVTAQMIFRKIPTKGASS